MAKSAVAVDKAQTGAPEMVPSSVLALASLMERDAGVLVALAEAGFLTTAQIREIGPFPSERRTRDRLAELRDRGLVGLADRFSRVAVSPSWHLTPKGARAVQVFGVQLPQKALSQGTALMRSVQLASALYCALRSQKGHDMTWALLPEFRWPEGTKADGRPPRPWAVIDDDGARIALDLDRPTRRQREMKEAIARWVTWRKSVPEWATATVLYVVATDVRLHFAKAVAKEMGVDWFVPTQNPRKAVKIQ